MVFNIFRNSDTLLGMSAIFNMYLPVTDHMRFDALNLTATNPTYYAYQKEKAIIGLAHA